MKILTSTFLVVALGACSDASFNDAPRATPQVEAPVLAEEPPPAPEPEPLVFEDEVPVGKSQVNASLSAEIEEAELLNKEYSAQIPGVSTVRVGVNFEDRTVLSDFDYNDAVLCFQGYFKVDQARVVSAINQTIVATTSSISGCNHTVEVLIVHPNGTSEAPILYDSRSKTPLNLAFKTGDRLNVSITAVEDECDAGVKKDMSNPNFAKVLIGICNTSGI